MAGNKKHFIVYITIVTFIFLIAFEIVILPLYFKMPRAMALLGFTSKPNTIVDDTAINSLGFTGDVIYPEKNPEKIRILTLGGSAIFNRRMTERLKDSLNADSDRPVEILGAALRTHTSMSSVIKYNFLSKYKFDYVLIYHGINDLFVNHVSKEYFKSDYSHMGPWYKRNALLDNSLIARVIYNNFIWGRRIFGGEKIWYIYPKDKNENEMEFISEQLFRRNITILVENILQDGGTPVLMTFAWSIPANYSQEAFIDNSLGYDNSDDYVNYPVELWGSVEYVREGLQRHNRILRQIAIEYDVLLLDQEKLMADNLEWFGDVCHFSEKGTGKFIDNVTNFLVQRRLLN